MRRWFVLFLAAMILLLAISLPAGATDVYTARPSVNGRLQVIGTALSDASGKPVQLRGVSTHGLTWYPEYVSEALFRQISEDWQCNLVRLAMYSELYCGNEREESLRLLRKGIEAAIAADQYVLVDWHILEDNNPNQHLTEAMAFFDLIASEYADCPNLLFEICNEPNGPLVEWADVKAYAEQVIPVIRRHIPGAVIVIGTPNYDRDLGEAALQPLAFDNIMYVLHFYTASHHEDLQTELRATLDRGLPVFISECGICEASGDGVIDFASAVKWFTLLNENKISYAVWSLSDKSESSAMFQLHFDPEGPIRDEDLTLSGKWVRELIRGTDPASIPAPAARVTPSFPERIVTWIARSQGDPGAGVLRIWVLLTGISSVIMLIGLTAFWLMRRQRHRRRLTYDDIVGEAQTSGRKKVLPQAILILCAWSTLVYMCWRVSYSIPFRYGVVAVTGNLLLLIVEIVGFMEFMVLYRHLLGMRSYTLPKIPDDAWPEVDVFIATYNEPTELLRKTVNGCLHMKYPDPKKVHIWICDDNRRAEMRALAEEMGVGYFDRPDNKGAKAGNLNHALGLTGAPYIVTFDADMIPRSEFLLKTIPYFVDAELREQSRPEAERLRLGLLQTPQCFYDPDVFQHALYCEKRAPNEQDFFYRTIEPAKTSTNSVIYGGSNTVLSRAALEAVGGFYTESITEDFATGLLIEAAGFVSLALPEPLASGQTPHTFREHIKQRTRWGRGVIVTARKLKIFRRKTLTLTQKISYLSSVSYWYSPLKSLIYILAPLMFAVFAIPVFKCSWPEIVMYWLPMFLLQDLCLRVNSRNTISVKWSGIYETSVMPHLLIPILKESVGISMSTFKVTDKSSRGGKRKRDLRAMAPFLFLIALSVVGIIRVLIHFDLMQIISIFIILFWIVRNLYYLVMAIFLADGRDSDGEVVRVTDAELVVVRKGDTVLDGITTLMTEHSLTVFLDDSEALRLGDHATVELTHGNREISLKGVVTAVRESRHGQARTHTLEILNPEGNRMEYLQLLYDRIPSLPQSLHGDFGALFDLWQNIVHRVARARR